MADIKDQLIKDSYNYVLQSDLSTGIVYRIGGDIPVNPIFSSGMTIMGTLKYQDGSESYGYVLTSDSSGNATWKPISGGTGGTTVTGGTFDSSTKVLTLYNSDNSNVIVTGFTDTFISGGTVSGTSIVFSYNDGNSFTLTNITPYSLFESFTSSTQNNLSQKVNKGGDTMTGQLNVPSLSSSGSVTAFTYFGDGSNLTGIPKAGGGSGGQIYYLNISNTQDGYYEFSPTPTSGIEQIISATTGSTQTVYIGGFLTPSNIPNLTQLPIGIVGFYLHAKTGSVSAAFNIYVELYKRSSGGTETLLLTTETVPVVSTTTQMYISDAYFSGATLDLTDRLLVKIYGQNTSNSTETIYLYSEGSNEYSFGITTIPSFIDTYVTGLTYSNNVLTLNQNEGKLPLTANIVSYKFYYQNTAPTGTGTASIDEGSVWQHSETGVEYKYNYDGNSYQWIQQTLPVGPQGPQGVNGTNNIDSGTTTTFTGVLIGDGVVVSAASITNVIGYIPENVANKETVALDSSNTKYPTNNVVNNALQSFSDEVDYATMINQRILFNY